MSLPQLVPGGMTRVRAAVPLLNQQRVPAGVHHDVAQPLPVTVTLRWATGTEELATIALEWTRTLVRVRITDLRVMTGAVWPPRRTCVGVLTNTSERCPTRPMLNVASPAPPRGHTVFKRATFAGAVIVLSGAVLSGCGSSAGEEAATAAYDACVKPEADTQVLVHDGNTVAIEIKGDAARALSGIEQQTDALLAGDEDAPLDGMGVGLAMLMAQDCLVEETGYPGSFDQLEDGDEWDGWRYETEEGAGSEFTARFIAMS